jgi:hypothetical protein
MLLAQCIIDRDGRLHEATCSRDENIQRHSRFLSTSFEVLEIHF